MPSLDLLLEGERRGILTGDQSNLLAEARRRGLAPGGESQQPSWSDLPGKAWDFTKAMLAAPVTGAMNAFPNAANFISETAGMIPDFGGRRIVPADEPIPSMPMRVLGGLKDVGSGVARVLNQIMPPGSVPIASAFTRNLAQMQQPTEAPPRQLTAEELAVPGRAEAERQRASGERFGELGVGYPALVKGISTALLPKVGKTAAYWLTAPTLGALPGLKEGDLPKAVEDATSLAVLQGVTHGAVKGTVGAAKGTYKYATETFPLRQRAKAAGGASGIISSHMDSLAKVEGELASVTVAQGGEHIPRIEKVARESAQAAGREMLDRVRGMASKETLPNAESADMANLLEGRSSIVQSAAEKKVGALSRELVPPESGGGQPIQIGKSSSWRSLMSSEVLEGMSPENRAKILGATRDSGIGAGSVTFDRLIQLDQDLNAIHVGNDSVARKVVAEAKKVVARDMERLDPRAPGVVSTVDAYGQFKNFWTKEVGERFGPESKSAELLKKNYSTPELAPQERIAEMQKWDESHIRKFYQDYEKWGGGVSATAPIKSAHVQSFIERITNSDGSFNTKKFVEEVAANPDKSPSTRQLRELVGEEKFQGLKQMADAIRKHGFDAASSQKGPAGMWSGFHVARAGMMALARNPLGATYHLTTALLMSKFPAVFDRMVSNKVGAKLLAEGIGAKPGTPAGDLTAAKIANYAETLMQHEVFMGRNTPSQGGPPRTLGGPGPTMEESLAADRATAAARAQVGADAGRVAVGDPSVLDYSSLTPQQRLLLRARVQPSVASGGAAQREGHYAPPPMSDTLTRVEPKRTAAQQRLLERMGAIPKPPAIVTPTAEPPTGSLIGRGGIPSIRTDPTTIYQQPSPGSGTRQLSPPPERSVRGRTTPAIIPAPFSPVSARESLYYSQGGAPLPTAAPSVGEILRSMRGFRIGTSTEPLTTPAGVRSEVMAIRDLTSGLGAKTAEGVPAILGPAEYRYLFRLQYDETAHPGIRYAAQQALIKNHAVGGVAPPGPMGQQGTLLQNATPVSPETRASPVPGIVPAPAEQPPQQGDLRAILKKVRSEKVSPIDTTDANYFWSEFENAAGGRGIMPVKLSKEQIARWNEERPGLIDYKNGTPLDVVANIMGTDLNALMDKIDGIFDPKGRSGKSMSSREAAIGAEIEAVRSSNSVADLKVLLKQHAKKGTNESVEIVGEISKRIKELNDKPENTPERKRILRQLSAQEKRQAKINEIHGMTDKAALEAMSKDSTRKQWEREAAGIRLKKLSRQ